jgi:hypothetical protein
MASPLSSPSPTTPERPTRALRWAVVLVTYAAALYYVIRSIHWPLMLDSPIMHYVVFLMQHGMKPYAQITDMNMPGAYLTEWLAMDIFGLSDLGWRIYEFFLLGALAATMCVIAGKRRWIAGLYAAGIFLAMHAAEGPRQAVERDEVIALLVMLSYAALFAAIQECRPAWMSVVGLAGGLSASIKPTFLPFAVFLLAAAFLQLRRRRIPSLPYLAWGAAGLAAIGALVFAFLLHYGALHNLLFMLRTVIPVYSAKGRPLFIAGRAIPKYFLPILPFALAAAIGNYRQGIRWNWEQWALAGGVLFGLCSYFFQGKGLVYHRYEYLVCLLLLIGMEVFTSIGGNRTWRWAGVGAVLVTLGFVVPIYMWNLHGVAGNSDLTLSLENDFQTLGGEAALQDKVQCLDLTTGCLNALYHLRIVENAGYTGDMLLFTRQQNAATEYFRSLYWRQAQSDPPTVLLLSNQDIVGSEGFNRLDNWLAFRSFLDRNYTQVIARSFPHEGLVEPAARLAPKDTPAYRIYIRNQSPLLDAAAHLSH